MALASPDLGVTTCQDVQQLPFVLGPLVLVDTDEDCGSASASGDYDRFLVAQKTAFGYWPGHLTLPSESLNIVFMLTIYIIVIFFGLIGGLSGAAHWLD
jgi:hypothetical protein